MQLYTVKHRLITHAVILSDLISLPITARTSNSFSSADFVELIVN